MRIRISDYWLCIGTAIWTLAKSVVHSWWIFFGIEKYGCDVKITTSHQLLVYFTYYYYDKCKYSSLANYIYVNGTETVDEYAASYQGIIFPESPSNKHLDDTYKWLSLITDLIWIVSSVSLFLGTIMKMKEWSAVFFFSPWVAVDMVTSLMDVVIVVYFVLQIQPTEEDLKIAKNDPNIYYDRLDIPDTKLVAVMFGRLGIGWLINLTLGFLICRATIKAYKKKYSDEKSSKKTKQSRIDQDARIRNWWKYYDDSEDGDTKESTSISTIEDSVDRDGSRKHFSDNVSEDMCSTFRSSSSLDQLSSDASSPTMPTVPRYGGEPFAYIGKDVDLSAKRKKVLYRLPKRNSGGSLDSVNEDQNKQTYA